MIYFTSDLHFGHRGIINHCHRPYSSVDEMDQDMIDRWNERIIDGNDKVYIIGDFAMTGAPRAIEILRQLNGEKFLIVGNHDKGLIRKKDFTKRFGFVKDMYTVKVPDTDAHNGKQRIVLLHYSMRVWNQSHHGTWHLYGHSHGTLRDDPYSLSFDIGVDTHNFYPYSYDDVKHVMSGKKWQPIDHHTERTD